MQEAYPDLPLLSFDSVKNCKKLNIVKEWSSDKLVFCPDMTGSDSEEGGRMMRATYYKDEDDSWEIL